ncbi:nuclear transport factor 2 family protein [Phaeodactylibacter luteus]|uniref:SnoaL-like domain-containing protein n=1 Tax=Phaeodactylibacter luteus TaxID=1564516 RepID=A0A5C6RUE6_9BACT|nr:nuclear transport factor 2 family protein [Phaeodactylibacter luteus]TXB65605.1 hypothetical protein FRY97_06380 [Phaeodactylibacter luteus]
MRYLFSTLFSLAGLLQLSAQPMSVFQAVKAPIEQLFDGMRASDSTQVRAAFLPGAGMYTAVADKTGEAVLRAGSLERFVQSVGQAPKGALDEQIWSYDIRIDGLLATAWTDYTFFYNGELSHCGTNAFELFKTAEGWKISHITDTRNREGCRTEAPDHAAEIGQLLDNWHRAAATADAAAFFGGMHEEGIYLGTDASERWLRDELREWAAFAFEREVAWDFRPYSRQLYFSKDGKTAWFEELLDTKNMGTCRGSGVLALDDEGWRIRHYDLSLMVPNERMDKVQEALKD